MGIADLVNGHLATFAERAGLEELSLDDDGACALTIGAAPGPEVQVTVEAIEDEGRIVFHARVAELGPEPSREALLQLLELNLFAAGTNGGALGLDRETGEAVLTYAWTQGALEYARFEALLEETFAGASHVRAALAALGGDAPTEGARPAPHDYGDGTKFVIQG